MSFLEGRILGEEMERGMFVNLRWQELGRNFTGEKVTGPVRMVKILDFHLS